MQSVSFWKCDQSVSGSCCLPVPSHTIMNSVKPPEMPAKINLLFLHPLLVTVSHHSNSKVTDTSLTPKSEQCMSHLPLFTNRKELFKKRKINFPISSNLIFKMCLVSTCGHYILRAMQLEKPQNIFRLM